MFSFKSKVCQDAFFKKTDSNKERLECFEDDNETVAGQASRWRKICKNILHKCKCNCHNSTYNALSKDWITQVLTDIQDLKLDLNLEDLKTMKKSKLKNMLNLSWI